MSLAASTYTTGVNHVDVGGRFLDDFPRTDRHPRGTAHGKRRQLSTSISPELTVTESGLVASGRTTRFACPI